MKRGQLTLLLIIAALLVISALFAFYILDLAIPDATPGAITQGDTRTETRLCLQHTGEQAILVALAQGGVNSDYWTQRGNVATYDIGSKTRLAYKLGDATTVEQGESAIRGGDGLNDARAPQEYIDVNGVPVRFWIFRSSDKINYWPEPSVIEFPPTGAYLGKLRTEPLCAQQGFNQPGASLDGSNSCLPGTYKILANDERSWQEALEDRITATARSDDLCDLPAPVTVALGEDDVTFISGTESVTVPIRLKRMYNLAFNLAKYETADATFDPSIVTGTQQVGEPGKQTVPGCQDRRFGNDCAIPGLSVTTLYTDDVFEHLNESEDVAVYPWEGYLERTVFEPYDDAWRQPATIISITDSTVTIDGVNPVLRFAVKNRYPVATGVVGDAESNITFTATDPDGVPVYVSCAEREGALLLPECTGATDKLSTTAWIVDKAAYCASGGPSDVRVEYILCSEPTRAVSGDRAVPEDWTTLLGAANTDPLQGPLGAIDALPRNCRLATASIPVSC